MARNFDNSVIGQIGSLIEEVNASPEKRASHRKNAENQAGGDGSAGQDPGGRRGGSSHPSAKADAGTQAARTGARADENAKDVSEEIPANVQGEGPGTCSDYNQLQIGTRKAPTGEDPSSEDDYKSGKEDPGTSHPANASEIGEKYSSWSFPEIYKVACDLTNNVLARIANGEQLQERGSKQASSQHGREADIEALQASEAGYELAKLASQLGQTEVDDSVIKFAAAQDITIAFQKAGAEEADLVGEFLFKTAQYEQQMLKQSEGNPMGAGMEGPPPGMEAGLPPGGPGGGAELPPEMGGQPSAGGEGGGPPMGGEGGGGGEDAINELANALIDAGVPPEKLMEAIQAIAAGEGGGEGAPPGAEAMMGGGGSSGPESAMTGDVGSEKPASARISRDDMITLYKAAASATDLQYSGRFKRVPANRLNKQSRAVRDETVNYLSYIREVFRV